MNPAWSLRLSLALLSLPAQAQVLSLPAPQRQEVEVTQFGYPSDRQFVVCVRIDDCEPGIRKTLDTLSRAAATETVMPAPAAAQATEAHAGGSDEVMSPRRKPALKVRHSKRIRAKHRAACACQGSQPMPPAPGSASRREK